jgi:hypothetical protein
LLLRWEKNPDQELVIYTSSQMSVQRNQTPHNKSIIVEISTASPGKKNSPLSDSILEMGFTWHGDEFQPNPKCVEKY